LDLDEVTLADVDAVLMGCQQEGIEFRHWPPFIPDLKLRRRTG
jgi:hypothetical protein